MHALSITMIRGLGAVQSTGLGLYLGQAVQVCMKMKWFANFIVWVKLRLMGP